MHIHICSTSACIDAKPAIPAIRAPCMSPVYPARSLSTLPHRKSRACGPRAEVSTFRATSLRRLLLRHLGLIHRLRLHLHSHFRLQVQLSSAILLCDIRSDDVARYQAARLQEKAAPKTVNLEVGTLRAGLRKNRLCWRRVYRSLWWQRSWDGARAPRCACQNGTGTLDTTLSGSRSRRFVSMSR